MIRPSYFLQAEYPDSKIWFMYKFDPRRYLQYHKAMRSLNGHLACLLSSGKNMLKFVGEVTGREEENVNHVSTKKSSGDHLFRTSFTSSHSYWRFKEPDLRKSFSYKKKKISLNDFYKGRKSFQWHLPKM